ncbi:uncharacterized protein B0H64DRAFT_408521 [Chaetomium fimeti]|uniref:Uncharacterized protein n=1 Tax=Chaetomium fimeti TaxID=1854472 RepID=A0AAE0H920_9PEZI|nr:hypothetical protein B0H64DRAFT_408521 [Chaetomium fimeti]
MTTPIPIALVEPEEHSARMIQRELLPNFEVVYVLTDPDNAIFQIFTRHMSKLEGNLDDYRDGFGVGTNPEAAEADRKNPRAIVLTPAVYDEPAAAIKYGMEHGPIKGVPVVRMVPRLSHQASVHELKEQLDGLRKGGAIKAD